LALSSYFDDSQIIQLLEAYVTCVGRERDIERAVNRAREYSQQRERGVFEPRSLWYAPNYQLAHDVVVKNTVSLEGLRLASPSNLKEARAKEVIDAWFPGNPLLCMAKGKNLFWTKYREDWRGKESRMQFIVPNEMAKPTGKTKDGRDSVRCLDNTGKRKFLVVEWDILKTGEGIWGPYVKDWDARGISTFDAQASLLVHLATKDVPRLQLALAVNSAGKSLQGWFRCEGIQDEQIRGFFKRATLLGADTATWTECQLVRMPGGTREDGNIQRVEYFNAG
jgi:hypothetical protein